MAINGLIHHHHHYLYPCLYRVILLFYALLFFFRVSFFWSSLLPLIIGAQHFAALLVACAGCFAAVFVVCPINPCSLRLLLHSVPSQMGALPTFEERSAVVFVASATGGACCACTRVKEKHRPQHHRLNLFDPLPPNS